MKTALTIYVTFCLICPLFNEEQAELPIESKTDEVLFWCDCGVVIHWRELPLKRI